MAPPPRHDSRLWILLIHAILVQLISYALRPGVSYNLIELGHGGVWIGVATALFALPPLILAIPSGRMVDRWGEQASLVCGSAAFVAAAALAVGWGHTLLGLLLSMMLLGLGVLGSVIGEQAWVMRRAPAGRLDSAFGIYTFATAVGQLIGPLLLLIPSGTSVKPGFETIAWSTMAAAIVCLALSAAIRSVPRPAPLSDATDRLPLWFAATRMLRSPGVPAALLTSSFVLTSLDIVLAYVPLLATERGLGPEAVTCILMLRGAGTMLSRATLGATTRRYGRRTVIVTGTALAAACLVALAAPLPVWTMLIAALVFGAAAGTAQPLTMSWMTLATAPEDRGLSASMRIVGNRTGQTFLPLALAGAAALGGAGLVLAASGITLVVSAVLARAAPDDAATG